MAHAHGHSSSLYSASADSLAKQVGKAVDYDDPEATLLTFTEVGSDKRTKVLKDASDEWSAWVPGASDVGLMWRKSVWSPLWKEPHKLTDKVWTDGQGRKHETWCASAILEHDHSGKALFLSVCHLPSNVQNGCAFNNNKQAAAWKSAVNGWHDYWNKIRKQRHPTMAMLVADWNIDFHKSCWVQWMKDTFPSMGFTWGGEREPADNKGTHGNRLIDATWTTGKVTKAKLLKDDNSSDHRPYGELIEWP